MCKFYTHHLHTPHAPHQARMVAFWGGSHHFPITSYIYMETITLGNALKFLRWAEANPDSEDTHWKVLECFYAIPRNEAMEMDLDYVMDAVNTAFSALSYPQDELIRTFTMLSEDGEEVRFGFHPNISDMKFGEFADATTYEQDPDMHNRLMAVLYRPIPLDAVDENGELRDYDLPPYQSTEQWADAMWEMPYTVYKSAIFFFVRLSEKLRAASLSYSEVALEKALQSEGKSLEQDGESTNNFMHWLKEMSSGWTMLRDSHFTQLCNGWSSRKKSLKLKVQN